ncbi:hypothetical protein ABPG77_011226 [Micractinium sp. CCAP 211/92]
MDPGRSLVPLAARDRAAHSTPLVGCWVAGRVDERHPLVAAACLRFLCSKALCDKATAADASFLLLLYPHGSAAVPLCFEVHISLEGGLLPLQAHRFSTSWHPEQGPQAAACKAAACPGLSLPGCPVALPRSSGRPPPAWLLAGTILQAWTHDRLVGPCQRLGRPTACRQAS